MDLKYISIQERQTVCVLMNWGNCRFLNPSTIHTGHCIFFFLMIWAVYYIGC